MCLLAELLLRPQALRLLRPIRINGVATCDRCSRGDRREATWHGQIGFLWIFSWFSCDLLGVFSRFWMGWDILRYVEMCEWPTRNEITLQIQRKPQFRCVLPLALVALVAWLNLHPVRLRGLTVDHSMTITIGDPSFCDILPTPMSKIYIQCSNIYVEETVCKINMEAESTSIISMSKKRYVNQRARWWNHNSMDAETA